MAVINGTSGADSLADTSGNDTINGLGGNDTINGGHGGSDVVDGGDGRDTLAFMTAMSAVVVDFVAGMAGTTSFTNIEKVVTGDFNDQLTGDGLGQNLTARAGMDTLAGGGGIDTLWGGAGNDTFVFREIGTANADTIGDWTSGQDTLLLDGAIMAALGASGDFVAGDVRFWASSTGAAHDADDRIIYNSTTRQIFYDADGNGSGGAQLIATLQSGATLVATDVAVEGGSSGQVINGTSGNDSLTGTRGDETINGLGGNDVIDGNGGSDSLDGGAGNDLVRGNGDNFLIDAGADVLIGGDGDDTLDGGNHHVDGTDANVDTLNGGLGNDEYVVDNEADVLVDAGGVDTVVAENIHWTLASGFENLIIDGGDAEIASTGIGNELDNHMTGNWGARLEGRGGDDTLIGSSGSSNGEDTPHLIGGDGNDLLLVLDSDYGALLDGGAGNDTLNAEEDGATLDGGLGDDHYVINEAGAVLMDAGGIDTVRAVDMSWTLGAGFENLFIANDVSEVGFTGIGNELDNQISATYAGSRLEGRDGDDTLIGASGQGGGNQLLGGAGNDSLVSGGLGDRLDGGTGVDILAGAGSEIGEHFVFSVAPGAANADVIVNFGQFSRVVLDGTAMQQVGPSGAFAVNDARFAANSTGAAQDESDRVVYNTSNGQLWYDADGNGASAAQLIATLQGAPALVATDLAVENGTDPGGPVINGTDGDDNLEGTNGDETLNGLGGNDMLEALAGNDELLGGAGEDTLIGGEGDDTLDGAFDGTHDDEFNNDTLDGGPGNDVYYAQVFDTILEDGGIDTLYTNAGADGITHGVYTLPGELENLIFQPFEDIDFEGFFIDYRGNAADNVIIIDNLHETSSSSLDGREGRDTLDGSGGEVEYIFSVAPGEANADTILGFSSGVSRLVISGNTHVGIGAAGGFVAGDARFAANSSGSAQDASDRVVYNTSNGQLWYDADGNGAAAAQLIATLQGAPTLAATDIVIEGGVGSGDDSLVGGPGDDTIDGGAGDDTLDGAGGRDSLVGGDGSDRLEGGTGNDTLDGGSEFDVLQGGDGDDILHGGADNDALDGGLGVDSLFGGDGDDRLTVADYGGDTIDGGVGNDSLDLFHLTGTVVVDLAAGTLRDGAGTGSASLIGIENVSGARFGGSITGDGAANMLSGDTGSDTLIGGGGDDTLSGGSGFTQSANLLMGGAGNDRLLGDFGADTLDGGDGDDTLESRGFGVDSLTGGAGNDLFVLGREFGGGFEVKRLADFTSGADTIRLEDHRMPNLGADGRLTAGDARFHAGAGATAAHDADDRIVYNSSTGELYYDADGTGQAATAQLIARLEGAPTLAATDITVGDGEPEGIAHAGSYRTVLNNGASSNRLDIVIAGDRYTADQIATDYASHVDSLIDYMFDDGLLAQPFGRYESFFNIHVIDAVSTESSHALGSNLSTGSWLVGSSAEGVVLDAMRGSGIDPDFRLAAINDARSGGSWDGAWATFPSRNAAANEIALHEAGHGIGNLADEYWTAGTTWNSGEPFFPNVTADPSGAKWAHWLGYEQPGIGVIGAYEGGFLHEHGIYRPSGQSKMQALGNPFDVVGREAFILEFYELVDPLDAYLATSASLENVDEFWVDAIDPDVILVDWIINGTTHVNAGERISLSALGYTEGEFSVTARAYDPTDWVRVEDRSSLEQTVQWTVVNEGTGNTGQVINGTAGADTLADTAGNDTINGLAGNDTINGGHGGNDVVNGGDGRDSLQFMTATGAVVVDFVTGVAGTTSFMNIEKLVTGDFSDRLTGDAAAQNLTARAGSDTLAGAGGVDTLWGGAGADTFIFRETGTANADTIGDWTSGSDEIELDNAAMAALGADGDFVAGDARFWASSTGTAHDANDRVLYNTNTRSLYYDADGNGSGAAQLIATVQAGATIAATDIGII